MNSHNSATAYSTSNKDSFKMEIISLMKKIRVRIDYLVSRMKLSGGSSSRKIAKNLSILKKHFSKLKELLKKAERMKEKEWSEKRKDLIKRYKIVYEMFQSYIIS